MYLTHFQVGKTSGRKKMRKERDTETEETEGVVKRNEEADRNEKEGGAERDDEGNERQR